MAVRQDHHYGIFTVSGFLTPAECEAWIERTEAIGYADAPISMRGGAVMMKDVRNNDRVMIDDPAAAAALWESAREHVPTDDPLLEGEPVGLNERLRFYRYEVGQKFDWHTDGHFLRPDLSEVSRLTFMVYLNEGFEGGETQFQRGKKKIDIVPATGMALFFVHRVRHQGAPVRSGRKYVLRSDVMSTIRPDQK